MSQPSAGTQAEALRYRRIRFAFGWAGLAVLVGGLAYLGAFPAGLGLVVLFGGPPLLGYVFGIRSLAGSVFTGLAMLTVIIGATLYVIGEAASSTAALGYLTLLVVGIPLVVVTAFFGESDTITVRIRFGRRGRTCRDLRHHALLHG